MSKTPTIEAIAAGSIKIKLGKASIKIPKLKISKKALPQKKEDQVPISTLINILLKTAIEKTKVEKRKNIKEGGKNYRIIMPEAPFTTEGGYGTVSKSYGSSPKKSYVDYEKIFSYLGKFRSKSAYEDVAGHLGSLNKATESGSFVLADRESMDKIAKFEKYFKTPMMDMPIMALSLVPVAGLSSAEWEEIKMMMKFDPIIYGLKTRIA